MPRAVKSGAAAVINYFRKTEIGTASEILELCKDALRERTAKSAAAKERAKPAKAAAPRKVARPAAVPVATVAANPGKAVARRKPGPKKGARKRAAPAAQPVAASTEQDVPLPLQDTYGDDAAQTVDTEAADLVSQ